MQDFNDSSFEHTRFAGKRVASDPTFWSEWTVPSKMVSMFSHYRDTIAIGAFTAMKKRIFVSCSADNRGPTKATLTNVLPWIMVKWVLE
ncbi:hypothetical protein V6N13_089663 [Hibiscus sabdariffa]|uniref:Uncharacterized protein n=1 Tax=Hibiscus sabdariffa TaxID=183260 RepID=A0ABR2QJ63_9ROSI